MPTMGAHKPVGGGGGASEACATQGVRGQHGVPLRPISTGLSTLEPQHAVPTWYYQLGSTKCGKLRVSAFKLEA